MNSPYTQKSSPLVSIVLTTFNSEATIKEVLNSVLNQDINIKSIELIIVDGGSSDNTLNILREFLEKYGNMFHSYKLIVHDNNYGLSKARNDGIKVSHGKYILILDDDVLLDKKTISSLLNYLESSDPKVIGAIPLHISAKGGSMQKWEVLVKKDRTTKSRYIASCTLIRREIIKEIGFYDETLGPPFTIYEELEYGARALAKGFEIHILGQIAVIHKTGFNIRTRKKGKRSNFFLSIMKFIISPKYRYALWKWLRSSPRNFRLRWYVYSILPILLVITLILSIILKSNIAILPLIVLIFALYLDVLSEYWNPKVPHISVVYSCIAFAWRIIRAISILLPKPKNYRP